MVFYFATVLTNVILSLSKGLFEASKADFWRYMFFGSCTI